MGRSIPGIFFLITGGIIAWFSKFVQGRTMDNSAMPMFFWIGIAFVAVGVLKIIFEIRSKMPRKERRHKKMYDHERANIHERQRQVQEQHARQHPHSYHQHHPVHQQMSAQHQTQHTHQQSSEPTQQRHHPQVQRANMPQHMSIIACPSCRTKHYSHANFCQTCGTRLK